MEFLDAYKELEKICGEMYSDNHGLSAYIDEMIKTSNGSYYVSGWNEDLKRLKHYRWVRNQIVHEPGCNAENMCEPEDVQWLNNFYLRIMSVNDPLALYRKEKNLQTAPKPKQNYTFEPTDYINTRRKKAAKKSVGCSAYIISVLLVFVVTILIAIDI